MAAPKKEIINSSDLSIVLCALGVAILSGMLSYYLSAKPAYFILGGVATFMMVVGAGSAFQCFVMEICNALKAAKD